MAHGLKGALSNADITLELVDLIVALLALCCAMGLDVDLKAGIRERQADF